MKTRKNRAVSLLESIFLIVILGIVSLGFGISMQSSAHIPDGVDQRLAIHTSLVDKMEDLNSLDFATLAANNALSDTVTIGNQSMPRTVTVTAIYSDFLEVTVTIGNQYLKTRVAQP
jgi:hypothetical protein